MTTKEKLDRLLLANSAIKTAVIFTEQALGSEVTREIFSLSGFEVINALRREIHKLEPPDEELHKQGKE